METTSDKILKIARDVFYNDIYPAIINKFPELKQKFLVNITSSVAYGTADKFSDLDMFLIFYYQKDYIKYAAKLSKFVENLDFPDHKNSFDKGIRLELESLARSDVSDIIYNPQNRNNWYNLPDWLMFWFINSVTLHVPKNIILKFKKEWYFYPKQIFDIKLHNLKLKLNKNLKLLQNHFTNFDSFIKFDRFVAYLNAFLDISFLTKKSFVPHCKWKETLFLKDVDNSLTGVFNKMLDDFLATKNISPLYHIENIPDMNFHKHGVWFPTYNDIEQNYKENTKIDTMFYLPDESGIFYSNKDVMSYDTANRISDKYKFFTHQKSASENVLHKQSMYYNFIIWRYIRVIDKAIKRKQRFTYLLYISITIRAILKCLAMLADHYLPPTEFLTTDFIKKITSLLKSDTQIQFQNLLNSDNFNEQIINNPQQTISLLWDIYYQIQLLLKNKHNLSDKIIKDPLSTQFKIEYWKYENLFL